ncbi:MAG: HAD hydrolase family protein [Methanomassiliicoccales archaeon]
MEFDLLDELIPGENRQFVTDGEGPITKNDNAFELCAAFIENGEKFFSVISRYDDVLSDVFHRQGYKAGDTLRLILPFLKAYGVTNQKMIEFSRSDILLVPGAKRTMRFVRELMQSFIVSTSYEHYVNAVCEAIGFPFENTYCTRVNLDSCKIDSWEENILRNYAKEIASMDVIEIPPNAKRLEDFNKKDEETIKRLDEIFWEEMTDLASYELILEVNPIGGEEKAAAILDVCRRTGIGIEDTMYVGDSITDVEAFKMVREAGGITVSFKGNSYAVRNAEIAVLSHDTVVTSVLAETFYKGGKESVLELVENWNLEYIRKMGYVHEYLVKELIKVFPEKLPLVVKVTPENMSEIAALSSKFRKTVRGEAIGALG